MKSGALKCYLALFAFCLLTLMGGFIIMDMDSNFQNWITIGLLASVVLALIVYIIIKIIKYRLEILSFLKIERSQKEKAGRILWLVLGLLWWTVIAIGLYDIVEFLRYSGSFINILSVLMLASFMIVVIFAYSHDLRKHKEIADNLKKESAKLESRIEYLEAENDALRVKNEKYT